MEAAAAFPHDIGAAELVLLDELRSAAAWQLPAELQPPPFPDAPPGLRDVRDYKVAAGGSDRLGMASPFNIKAESLTLLNFTRDEVASLYAQRTSRGSAKTPGGRDIAVIRA